MTRGAIMAKVRLFLLLLLPALAAAGCARLHAKNIGPPLEMPAPPPRVVPVATAPIESQPIVVSPPVGEVQPPSPAPVPVPAPTPPVATERPAQPAPEPPSLQTTANPSAAEQRTRAALASATRDLGRIDTRSLGADARAQYDIARRFVAQAADALNAKNYEFAQQLADKAATLAALLQR